MTDRNYLTPEGKLPPTEPEKTRRIVQIAIASGGRDREDLVAVLCNDASMWMLVWGEKPGNERWARIVGIPQDG